jgi:hypothetical protein
MGDPARGRRLAAGIAAVERAADRHARQVGALADAMERDHGPLVAALLRLLPAEVASDVVDELFRRRDQRQGRETVH